MNHPLVYLCDLRYNYSGVLANDCMPLGVAYMKAVIDQQQPEVHSRLFAYPDRLVDAMQEQPPDVLMLSNYCWNEALSLHMAKLAKRFNPRMLVVMGGPNISLEAERQQEYLRDHPNLDLYVLGEGDFLAAEVVRQFVDCGMSITELGGREIPSSLYRRPDGSIARTAPWDRHKEVDTIPSPWLSGILDEFFDGKLAPIIETNRGCPFTCTFCCQGTSWYTKVHYFTKERLREEIFYIADRIAKLSPMMHTLRIADSNYGMFERDAELSGYLGETQKLYGWPTYIDATTGKNRPDRIIKSIEKVNGAMLLYQAVQSLDEGVLRNVKRSTIKMQAYEQLRVYMRGRGLRSNTDLILGLPGETLKSHMDGIRTLLDAGLNQVTNFQLMMLKGTELETVESRNLFKFQSGFRILPKNFGIYGGEKVFDVEEIVVSTDTLSFDDYLRARKVALASAAFWHDNCFEKVIAFAGTQGVRRSEWLDAILEEMESDPGEISEFLKNFVAETVNELFSSREACIEFYSREENFAKLQSGDVGDNLMHKYRAISSFYIWPAICACAMRATRKLLEARGVDKQIPDFDVFWDDFHRFIDLGHAHGHTTEAILAGAETEMSYDIEGWLAAGSPIDPSSFKLSEPTHVLFRLDDDSARELHAALQSWTDTLKGLTKMVTRIQVVWQERRCHIGGEPVPVSAFAAAAD
jgi:radical SAM superfamily enzyme YgiQ (UPF0313 family)